MPSLGEVPSLPGDSGIQIQGDNIVFCGHGFGLQWLLDVSLLLVLQCEQRVPALQVSHLVSSQFLPWPSLMTKWPWSDPI